MDLPPRTVLKVIKPPYGILEAGLYWYITDLSHHVDTFRMSKPRMDPFLLVKRVENRATEICFGTIPSTGARSTAQHRGHRNRHLYHPSVSNTHTPRTGQTDARTLPFLARKPNLRSGGLTNKEAKTYQETTTNQYQSHEEQRSFDNEDSGKRQRLFKRQ